MPRSVGRRLGAILAVVVLLSAVLVPAASAGGYPGAGGYYPPAGCKPLYYRVRPGDNLTKIAYRYGTTVWNLTQWNNLWNPDRIYIGQVLIVKPCYYPPKPPKPPKPPQPPCPPPHPPPHPPWPPCPPPQPTGWWGEYWNNKDLSGTPVLTRNEGNLCFNWGYGSPDLMRVPPDFFSARWNRSVKSEGAPYRITIWSDDGVRVFLDGNLIIDGWKVQAVTVYSRDIFIPVGTHTLTVEYFENDQQAQVCLEVKRL